MNLHQNTNLSTSKLPRRAFWASSRQLGSCEQKRPEMETACSIIPDTGTTLVVGPEAQIAILYEEGGSQGEGDVGFGSGAK